MFQWDKGGEDDTTIATALNHPVLGHKYHIGDLCISYLKIVLPHLLIDKIELGLKARDVNGDLVLQIKTLQNAFRETERITSCQCFWSQINGKAAYGDAYRRYTKKLVVEVKISIWLLWNWIINFKIWRFFSRILMSLGFLTITFKRCD